jgi:hypothetical protein
MLIDSCTYEGREGGGKRGKVRKREGGGGGEREVKKYPIVDDHY